ncbi:MAG: hypothetical protein ACM3ZE_13630 [Myxococcales bacterium]
MHSRISVLSMLTCLVAASGCATVSEDETELVAAGSSALSASDHFYLRCNVTSWQLDSAAYMAPVTADGQLRALEFTVDENWELSGNTCQVTSTDILGEYGPATAHYTSLYGALAAPGGAQLRTGGQQFVVTFPKLGRYRATINAANGSFSITSAETTPEPERRRGLGVITNFQNRTIADHEGSGVRTQEDLRTRLDAMQDHWSWLSRGKEEMVWDILEVTLPQNFTITPCSTDADCADGGTCRTLKDEDSSGNVIRSWQQCEPYAGWWYYREQVIAATFAELQRRGIDSATYDFDKDGDIDAIWAIAADGGIRTEAIIGGASGHSGAHIFVDGQASQSVTGGHYGNFNHEVGHLRELPDLYGRFSNLSELTVMASSWPLPPHDLDAYSRTLLGWAQPQVIEQSSSGVQLASANDAHEAVKVPTGVAGEYFLIEYRVTPSTGYGSNSPELDGLIVYHVLEGSNQTVNPPLLKVEPADGALPFGDSADQSDALTPSNTNAQTPFVVKTYAGDEAFRITRVNQNGTKMSFDITVAQ